MLLHFLVVLSPALLPTMTVAVSGNMQALLDAIRGNAELSAATWTNAPLPVQLRQLPLPPPPTLKLTHLIMHGVPKFAGGCRPYIQVSVCSVLGQCRWNSSPPVQLFALLLDHCVAVSLSRCPSLSL